MRKIELLKKELAENSLEYVEIEECEGLQRKAYFDDNGGDLEIVILKSRIRSPYQFKEWLDDLLRDRLHLNPMEES